MDPAVEQVLTEALKPNNHLQPISYNEGSWQDWICTLLSAYGQGDHLEKLLEVLKGCNHVEAIKVTAAILNLVDYGPLEGRRRRALECIHDGPGWGLLNYHNLLDEFGFPDTKAGLRRWLDGEGE